MSEKRSPDLSEMMVASLHHAIIDAAIAWAEADERLTQARDLPGCLFQINARADETKARFALFAEARRLMGSRRAERGEQ